MSPRQTRPRGSSSEEVQGLKERWAQLSADLRSLPPQKRREKRSSHALVTASAPTPPVPSPLSDEAVADLLLAQIQGSTTDLAVDPEVRALLAAISSGTGTDQDLDAETRAYAAALGIELD